MTTYWQPYSGRAARVRRFIPDVTVPLSIGHGMRMQVSLKKHLYILRPSTRRNEIQIAETLAEYVPANGVMFDIGANIGLYSLVFARTHKVHAFEPAPKALYYLNTNIRLNNLSNILVHPIVLSDHEGVCRFTLDDVTLYTSHVSANGEKGEELPCFSLDAYMKKNNLPEPALVKMDIEGADEEVLRGMSDLIDRKRCPIFLEGGLRDASGRIIAVDYLKNRGYEIWDLDKSEQLDATTPAYMFIAWPQ